MEASDLKTIRVIVYEKLREAIITGSFKPGEPLIERVISEEMKVSRTPIREALRKLELERLVTTLPYRGVVVTELTADDAKQIYEAHAVLQGLVCRLAAVNACPETLTDLENSIINAESDIRDTNLENMIKSNRQFHLLLLNCAGNEYLVDMIASLQAKIALLRVKTLSCPDRARQNLDEHKLIHRALVNGDEQMAELLGNFHIRNAAKTALRLLQKSNENV